MQPSMPSSQAVLPFHLWILEKFKRSSARCCKKRPPSYMVLSMLSHRFLTKAYGWARRSLPLAVSHAFQTSVTFLVPAIRLVATLPRVA